MVSTKNILKNNLKKLVDTCGLFQTKGYRWTLKRVAIEFFDMPYKYFHMIYRGKINPGANTREHIVAKLREAGYPELRYEDVWCPEEVK